MAPRLIDGWFCDRSPGAGKVVYATPGDASTARRVGLIRGIGSGFDPSDLPVLAPAGDTIPNGSSGTSPAGLTRLQIMESLGASTGFSGSEIVYGWTAAAGSSKTISLSCWVNFGVSNIPGWNPVADQGSLFTILSNRTYTQDEVWHNGVADLVNADGVGLLPLANFVSPESPDISDGSYDASGGAVSYPLDSALPSKGWVHLMIAAKLIYPNNPPVLNYSLQGVIYINDTEIFNGTLMPGASFFPLGPWGANVQDLIGNVAAIGFNQSGALGAGTGLYGAVAEYWLTTGSFIDWSVQANREKFHVKDTNLTISYAPCSLGATGATPTGTHPLLYLRGSPQNFIVNRATGATLLKQEGATGLVLVTDQPE